MICFALVLVMGLLGGGGGGGLVCDLWGANLCFLADGVCDGGGGGGGRLIPLILLGPLGGGGGGGGPAGGRGGCTIAVAVAMPGIIECLFEVLGRFTLIMLTF